MSDARGADPAAVWRAGRDGCVLVDLSGRGRLTMTGGDRSRLLHRISTNDIESLTPGTGTATLLATPKGRLIDRLVVLCLPDEFLVITSTGTAALAAGRIGKYVVIEDVSVVDRTASTFQLGLYGPRAPEVLERAGCAGMAGRPLFAHVEQRLAGHHVRVTTEPGLAGRACVVIGEPSGREEVLDHLLAGGAAGETIQATPESFEPLRILAGLPSPGHELTDAYNPLELRQEDAVSFDKGCYVGQEVIARLRTYDKVRRRLICLEVEGEAPVPVDIGIQAPGMEGTITSAAPVPGEHRTVALAVVSGDPQVGQELAAVAGTERRRAWMRGEPVTARDVRRDPPRRRTGS
ncbi:MAG: YgfZ/GcvT domain-containing protein [Acidobacteriota bacterium]